MHLESNDSSPGMNRSDPSTHPHSNQQGFVSVNPAKGRQQEQMEKEESRVLQILTLQYNK